jgi:hypothetical protein
MPPTFIEATRSKEIQAFLKFGRDSNCPLRVTISCHIFENTSVAITYGIGWEGCTSTEEWFRAQLSRSATEDGLSELPAVSQENWGFTLRKEGNSFRAVFYQQGVDTPELPGMPTLHLYGPLAEIKIRAPSIEAYEACMNFLYQKRYQLTGIQPTHEWARIGAFGGGKIPDFHRIFPPTEALP